MADSEILRAEQCWRGGQPLETGRLVFESLPSDSRPRWAARILRLVLAKSGVQGAPFDTILRLADDRSEWGKAHSAFSTLRRDSTLRLDELKRRGGLTKDRQLLGWLLAMAELVAKVTYNATNPPDEFDEDSGWWIVASLRGFVDLWSDEKFSAAAWDAVLAKD